MKLPVRRLALPLMANLCGCAVTSSVAGGYSHELLDSSHGGFIQLGGAFIDTRDSVGLEAILNFEGGEGGLEVGPYLGLRAGPPPDGSPTFGLRLGASLLEFGYDRIARVGTLGASALAEGIISVPLDSVDWLVGETHEVLDFVFGLTASVGYGRGGDGVTLLFGIGYTFANSL